MDSFPVTGVFGAQDGTLTCIAPDDTALVISFYSERGCLIGGETIPPGETRVVLPEGSSWGVSYRVPAAA